MRISELLDVCRISCSEQLRSKKRALEELSKLIASSQTTASQEQIFDSLIQRERLGTTGLGHGVAIPHARIRECDVAIAAVIKLQQGIDFDAPDGQPVDLLFAMLIPEDSTDEHLQILAQLAEMFGDEPFVNKLRAAEDSAMLYKTLQTWHT